MLIHVLYANHALRNEIQMYRSNVSQFDVSEQNNSFIRIKETILN